MKCFYCRKPLSRLLFQGWRHQSMSEAAACRRIRPETKHPTPA